MYAYVMEWGSDYIPSDADGEGSLKWLCKTERTGSRAITGVCLQRIIKGSEEVMGKLTDLFVELLFLLIISLINQNHIYV